MYKPPTLRAYPDIEIVPGKYSGTCNGDERACSAGGGAESRGLNTCASESHLKGDDSDSGTVQFPSIELVGMHVGCAVTAPWRNFPKS